MKKKTMIKKMLIRNDASIFETLNGSFVSISKISRVFSYKRLTKPIFVPYKNIILTFLELTFILSI